MTYEIQYAKAPRWADSEKTMIDLIVKFSHLDNEVPFTATLNDIELHGRELFVKARNGSCGTVADFIPVNEAVIIPSVIQMRQFRLELLSRSLLEYVPTAISSIQDDQKRQQVQIEWEYSTNVDKNSEWVKLLASALNLSQNELDILFLEASKK